MPAVELTATVKTPMPVAPLQRDRARQCDPTCLPDLLLEQAGIAHARMHIRAVGHLLSQERHVHRADHDARHDEQDGHRHEQFDKCESAFAIRLRRDRSAFAVRRGKHFVAGECVPPRTRECARHSSVLRTEKSSAKSRSRAVATRMPLQTSSEPWP